MSTPTKPKNVPVPAELHARMTALREASGVTLMHQAEQAIADWLWTAERTAGISRPGAGMPRVETEGTR